MDTGTRVPQSTAGNWAWYETCPQFSPGDGHWLVGVLGQVGPKDPPKCVVLGWQPSLLICWLERGNALGLYEGRNGTWAGAIWGSQAIARRIPLCLNLHGGLQGGVPRAVLPTFSMGLGNEEQLVTAQDSTPQ